MTGACTYVTQRTALCCFVFVNVDDVGLILTDFAKTCNSASMVTVTGTKLCVATAFGYVGICIGLYGTVPRSEALEINRCSDTFDGVTFYYSEFFELSEVVK
jgi:hypothetical protein